MAVACLVNGSFDELAHLVNMPASLDDAVTCRCGDSSERRVSEALSPISGQLLPDSRILKCLDQLSCSPWLTSHFKAKDYGAVRLRAIATAVTKPFHVIRAAGLVCVARNTPTHLVPAVWRAATIGRILTRLWTGWHGRASDT